MDFLKGIIRSLKHLLNPQSRDSKSEEAIRSVYENIDELNPKKLTALRVQYLKLSKLSKEQLVEMLFKSSLANQSLESIIDDKNRQIIGLLDDTSSMLHGDLSAQCGWSADCIGVLGDNINLLVQDLEEAVSQLSPDHHLFKKYKTTQQKFVAQRESDGFDDLLVPDDFNS